MSSKRKRDSSESQTPDKKAKEEVPHSHDEVDDYAHLEIGTCPYKIDLHTHILPENYPDLKKRYGYGDWVRLEHHCANKAKMFKGDKFFREIEENCYRSEPRVKDMAKTGVTVQVLSTVPVMFSYWAKPEDTLDLCVLLNDHIANIVKKNPKRFVGLATLPMQEPDLAIKELKRCMAKGFAGIQIGSHVNKWPLSEPKLFPIFEEAERLGACIFVHPWDMLGEDVMSKYWLPWLVGMPMETAFAICSCIFGGIFERLPNLRWAFAHGGGSFPGTIGRIEHGHAVRPDLVAIDSKQGPRAYCGKFWVDSLVHDEVALKSLTNLVGVEKVVCGSDYPFPLGEDHPGALIEKMSCYTRQDKEKMLWINGLEFLGIKDEQQFWPDEHKKQFQEQLQLNTTELSQSSQSAGKQEKETGKQEKEIEKDTIQTTSELVAPST